MNEPRIIDNDALVVLCLHSMSDTVTHHTLRVRARARGFQLTKSQCVNMLSRAKGRVAETQGGGWRLTAAGQAYRDHALAVMARLLAMESEVPA